MLRVVLQHPQGLTLSDAARLTGLSRAAARRFLLTLCDEGLVRQCANQFVATPSVARLGQAPVLNRQFWNPAEQPMRLIAQDLSESSSMAVLDGAEIVYVARATGPRVLSVRLDVGSRLPAAQTSMGRVLLASLPQDRMTALIDACPTSTRTRFSVTDPNALKDEVARVRKQGYSIVDQELEEGLISLSVPVTMKRGTVISALNISTSPSRFSSDELAASVVPKLRQAAAAIVAALGCSPASRVTAGAAIPFVIPSDIIQQEDPFR
ncbi:MAG: helix-turn-helix domain-containing protein [Rhodospirillales bacterium]|nr:helix-turn-helix domain-containing protein [Rhodospirillales bacterium]